MTVEEFAEHKGLGVIQKFPPPGWPSRVFCRVIIWLEVPLEVSLRWFLDNWLRGWSFSSWLRGCGHNQDGGRHD